MPDLKPSEELLGQAHRSMRADLRLLCGIYDQLAALNARLATPAPVGVALTVEAPEPGAFRAAARQLAADLATRDTVPATPKAQRPTPKTAPKE